jgi:ATPase
VRNFEDHALEHEIYTFGEENVIVPVSKKTPKFGVAKLAEEKIREEFRRFDPQAEVEIVSDNKVIVKVDKKRIASVIGPGGSTINNIERMLNVKIDVVERGESDESTANLEIPFSFAETKTGLSLTVNREFTGFTADIYAGGRYVTSARIGRKGRIKIPMRSESAKKLMKLATSQKDVQLFVKDF